VQEVDQHAFVVGLEDVQGDAQLAGQRAQLLVDLASVVVP
jgi:hypothetical protein